MAQPSQSNPRQGRRLRPFINSLEPPHSLLPILFALRRHKVWLGSALRT